MCAANNGIIEKVNDLMEIRKMIEELENEATAITDEIKEFMQDEETMVAGPWKVTYGQTISKRIDSAALKKDLGADALEAYYKTVITRPFKVS